MRPQVIGSIELRNEVASQEVICEGLAMAEALQSTIHIARIGEVIKAHNSESLLPNSRPQWVLDVLDPIIDRLHSLLAEQGVERLVPMVAGIRAIMDPLALAGHNLFLPLCVQPRAAITTVLGLGFLSRLGGSVSRCGRGLHDMLSGSLPQIISPKQVIGHFIANRVAGRSY